jgi:hypothetical protein
MSGRLFEPAAAPTFGRYWSVGMIVSLTLFLWVAL